VLKLERGHRARVEDGQEHEREEDKKEDARHNTKEDTPGTM